MGTPTKASDRRGGYSIPPIAVASMDDDPPDPFSPDAPGPSQRLPGDVVTPRTASARRALREHELALRAHESGTAEYRRMLSDAEQGMEKLLTMNAALRRELELERRVLVEEVEAACSPSAWSCQVSTKKCCAPWCSSTAVLLIAAPHTQRK